MVKLTIELFGNEEDVLSFVGLCSKIELMGLWGVSRTIPLSVDGDGSADLKFNIKANIENKGEVDLIKAWKEKYKEKFQNEVDSSEMQTHYIGE